MNGTQLSGAPPDPALRMLVALCGALARRDQAALRELLRPGRVDWPALRRVADRHRLTGYLSAQLQGAGPRAGIAPDFLFHARHVYLQQWVRNGQLLREMERIALRLEADRLPYLFFKGPLLANRLYDQLGSRAIHDIDLLIPRSGGMAGYESALAALGYRRFSRLLLPLSWSRSWLHQLEYKSDRFTLEPHWDLQRHPSLRLDAERMWRERVMLEMPAGAAVPALADEYTLLANLLSIPVDLQNASLGLRTYFELFLLWRRFPGTYDWPAFWERRRAERTQRLTRVVLALLQDLFGPAGLEAAGALPLPEEARPLVAALGAQLFGTAPGEWRRRQLAFRLFEAPLPVSLLWWSLTLPARALAHPAVTRERLRRW
jgi:hypothetical protein